MLLPLQGALLIAIIPRAMPWARSFCPLPFPSAGDRWFRACRAYMRNLNFLNMVAKIILFRHIIATIIDNIRLSKTVFLSYSFQTTYLMLSLYELFVCVTMPKKRMHPIDGCSPLSNVYNEWGGTHFLLHIFVFFLVPVSAEIA